MGLGRGFPSYPNQCAIRMGVALRGAGVTIDQLGRITTCDFHPRDEMHTLNAAADGGCHRRAADRRV